MFCGAYKILLNHVSIINDECVCACVVPSLGYALRGTSLDVESEEEALIGNAEGDGRFVIVLLLEQTGRVFALHHDLR